MSSSDYDDLQSYLKETEDHGSRSQEIDWSKLLESAELEVVDKALYDVESDESSNLDLFLKTPVRSTTTQQAKSGQEIRKLSANKRSFSADPNLHAVSELRLSELSEMTSSSVSDLSPLSATAVPQPDMEDVSEASEFFENVRNVSDLSVSISDRGVKHMKAVNVNLPQRSTKSVSMMSSPFQNDDDDASLQLSEELSSSISDIRQNVFSIDQLDTPHQSDGDHTPSESTGGGNITTVNELGRVNEAADNRYHPTSPEKKTTIVEEEYTYSVDEDFDSLTSTGDTHTRNTTSNTTRRGEESSGQEVVSEGAGSGDEGTEYQYTSFSDEGVTDADRSETSYSQPAVDLPPSKDKQPPTIKTKQLRHNNQQDASVQTTSYPTTFDIPNHPHPTTFDISNHPHPTTFDIPNHPPTPILPYVLPAGKLEALSSFSPTSVALTDLIQSQLSLIRFSMETTQRQVANIYASTQSGHHYTTLEETKAYIERNKPKILTMREAKNIIEHKHKL